MLDEERRKLERAAATGDPAAATRLQRELVRDVRGGDLAARYAKGDRKRVWSELWALAWEVRAPANLAQARAVAHETMLRVRRNVETVAGRLTKLDYRFAGVAHTPPSDDATARLDALEDKLGPLPLSLRAFYEVVGAVDFRQDPDQTGRSYAPEDGGLEVPLLGDEDPLLVAPLDALAAVVARSPRGDVPFWFATPSGHKTGDSADRSPHVVLPYPRADFLVSGPDPGSGETFLGHLRRVFKGGGFRGRHFGTEPAPRLRVVQRLAKGLLPL